MLHERPVGEPGERGQTKVTDARLEKYEFVIEAMMATKTKKSAAKKLGITPQGLGLIRRDPLFVRMCRDVRARIMDEVINRHVAVMADASEVLHQSLKDKKERITNRSRTRRRGSRRRGLSWHSASG
jgi:hypothetical protein